MVQGENEETRFHFHVQETFGEKALAAHDLKNARLSSSSSSAAAAAAAAAAAGSQPPAHPSTQSQVAEAHPHKLHRRRRHLSNA